MAADREAVAAVLAASWGGTTVVAHATVHETPDLPALLAERGGRLVGLLTYAIADVALEVVSLDAVAQRDGVGSALLAAAADTARQAGARRL